MVKLNKYVFILMLFMAAGVGAQVTLYVDIKTGNDNLEKKKYQYDPAITIKLRDGRDVKKSTINRGQTWGNNSVNRVTIPLPENATLDDVTEFILERQRNYGTGGYRFDTWEKDDWVVKSINISAVVRESGRTKNVNVAELNNRRGDLYRFTFNASPVPGDGFVYRAPVSYLVAAPAPTNTRNAIVTATFGTGRDDLRGRGDNVRLVLKIQNSTQTYTLDNLNSGLKWDNNSEITVTKEIPNSERLDLNTISSVVVHHTGINSNDEWHLNRLKVVIRKEDATGQDSSKLLVNRTASPLHRFTQTDRQKAFSILAASDQKPLKNITMTVEFTTGGDDLRGGNDNVDMIVHLKNSHREIIVPNVNRGENWPNNSTRRITNKELESSYELDLNDIKSIELRHTGGGGTGADNWDLAAFKVTAYKEGKSMIWVNRAARLIHRFSGDSRTKLFVIEY